MKTCDVTIYCKNGHAFAFACYTNKAGQPAYEYIQGRGDLPNIYFNTTAGEFWMRGTEILAIQHSPTTTTEAALQH